MAFTPKTLGGSVGQGFFTYETGDTEATVVTAGYFKSVDGNGQLLGGEGTSDGMLRDGDIIQAQTADGFALLIITVSTATEVSAVAKLSAV